MKYVDLIRRIDFAKAYGIVNTPLAVIVTDCSVFNTQTELLNDNITVYYYSEGYAEILERLKANPIDILAFFVPKGTEFTDEQDAILNDLTERARKAYLPFTVDEKYVRDLILFDIRRYMMDSTYKDLPGNSLHVVAVLNVGEYIYAPSVVFTVNNKIKEYCLPISHFLNIVFSYGVPEISDCLQVNL